jgi:uncharacterized protein
MQDKLTRKGDWMQTYTGRKFWPLDPRPDEIDIIDVAAALSKMCRFGGHCLNFYSVAEHCVLTAKFVSEPLRLTALLHDASEAYLVDIPRPIKRHLANYNDIEAQLMACVATRFGTAWPLPEEVKRVDTRILGDERGQNMLQTDEIWLDPQGNTMEPLGATLKFWAPPRAMSEFISAFREYLP